MHLEILRVVQFLVEMQKRIRAIKKKLFSLDVLKILLFFFKLKVHFVDIISTI